MNTTLKPSLYGDIFALIIGGLLPLAFAPFNIDVIALIIPGLLLYLWLPVSPKRALWRGWLFGLGFFGVGVSWVYISIHTFGQGNIVLSGIASLLMVAILAIFPAIQGYFLNRFFPHPTITKCIFAFPSSWVLLEWLRESFLSTGFPWLYLGYSQMDSFLRGFAPIGSVYAVSFAVVLTNGLLISLTLFEKKRRWLWILPLLLVFVWAAGFALNKIHWTQPNGSPIQVSLIQGDIPQTLKWSREQVIDTLNLYRNLTEKNWDSPLIVWPEAAITILQTQAKGYIDLLASEAKLHNVTIISGIPIVLDEHYYNGMLAFGNSQSMYLKNHLVPFGEFMPFRSLLNWLDRYVQIPMSDFSAGKKNQPPFIVNGIRIAPFICYEIAYPTEVVNSIDHSQLIVVLTDDSWFGRSIAPMQHLQIAQMRALETGRYLLMSTNNGETAIINAQGKIQQTVPSFSQNVLTGKINFMVGETPWMIFKIYPLIIIMLIMLLIAYILQRRT